MKLRMLSSIAGVDFALAPGDEREFDEAEAVRLIEAGFAVAVIEAKIETSVRKPAAEKRAKG